MSLTIANFNPGMQTVYGTSVHRIRKAEHLDLILVALMVIFFLLPSYSLFSEYLGEIEELKPIGIEIYRHGSRESKKVALTIDDCWVDDKPLFNLLEKYNIICTMFIPGKVAENRKEWVTEYSKKGFEVCNHTYSHVVLTNLREKEIREEIRRGQEVLTEITGKIYPYFRPPSGQYNQLVLNILSEMGYIVIMWENDVLGYWKDRPISSQFKYIREHKKNGNIILSHPGKSIRAYEVLKVIIPEMLEEGYEFVTITELLEELKGRRERKTAGYHNLPRY